MFYLPGEEFLKSSLHCIRILALGVFVTVYMRYLFVAFGARRVLCVNPCPLGGACLGPFFLSLLFVCKVGLGET